MRYVVLVGLLFVCVRTQFAQIAQGPASGSIPGGAVVNTDNFENYDEPVGPVRFHVHPEVPLQPPPPNMPPPTGPEGSNYFEDLSVRSNAPQGGPPPITIASFQGNNLTSGFPPDPILAVGPNHIMHLVNSSFRISDKNGNTLKTISANAWYNSVLPNSGAFDPKVFYDFHANRWVMLWDNQNDATQTSYFLISVSDDDNPLGIWFNWAMPSNVYGSTNSGTWQDYPGFGYDSQAFYIVGRHFGFVSGYFGNAIRVLPKQQFLGSTPGPITWWDFWALRDNFGNDVDGVRPAIVLSNPNEYYVVGPPALTSGTYFAVYRITNPLGTPSISCVHVPVTAWTNAPNAGQLGGGQAIEAGGSRVRHEPIYRDSSLWAAHSINNQGYSAIRYVRIYTPLNTAIEDAAMGALGFWHFYPALAVDKDNNIGITFSRSGDTEYAGAYFTWRLASDLPGTFRPTEVMRPGAGNYVVLGGGRNRWGDYMGAALDPADRSNIWFLTEYASATNQFAVWVHGTRFVPYNGARVFSSVTSRDFGRVEANFSSDTMEIKISNIGTNNLVISNISRSQSAYTLLNLPSFPATLASFDSLKFRVFFRPTVHGVVQDTIRIVSNDTTNPTFKIPLTGKGVVIGRAVAGILYGASGPPSVSALYTINTSTGAATQIGPTGLTDVHGLAIHPTSREIYGVVTSGSFTQLYRLSSGYGDALFVRTIPLGNTRAIAFASDGTLYAGNNIGRLYRINIATGDTTYVGTASGIVYAGLSFNPITGALWASVRPPIVNRDKIYRINTTTGAATEVGSTGGGNITPDIAFDARGILYGIKGTSTQIDTLIVIDTTTAFGTRIGSMGLAGIQAMVMRTDSVGSLDVRQVDSGIPATYALEQNYPNPFNPSTTIVFKIRATGYTSLKVYDMLGREVATLVSDVKEPGSYEVTWDARSMASGVYLYRLESGPFVATRKLLLLR
ncbi:MAG TPA: T9SS type A sorting domain-containing protein [Bacteroidota bacterium]|nr:T9SS type A sorting domain-containing protein [Bacteroidota bacterium]